MESLQSRRAGLRTCVFMTVRLIFLVMGSSIMTFTTTPNSLTDGIEKLLHPLNRIHVPVHEIAMMMSIALRFIPILLEETDKIMKAQIARGADFESGNILQRAKAMIPILVHCSYLHSDGQMIWQWQWKQDVTMAGWKNKDETIAVS